MPIMSKDFLISLWIVFVFIITPIYSLWESCEARPIVRMRTELRLLGYKNIHLLSNEEVKHLYEKHKK